MLMASFWAMRSTCFRACVGAIITTIDLTQVLSIGYNGPACGLDPSHCSNIPGNCGCLHAEENALLRCHTHFVEKAIFITTSPCFMCAQRIINAGIRVVYYGQEYRNSKGLELLIGQGIQCHHTLPALSSPLTVKLLGSTLSMVTDHFASPMQLTQVRPAFGDGQTRLEIGLQPYSTTPPKSS